MEKQVDGPRERDESIERLLRQSLKAERHAGASDACLDAETLAAWADGNLSGAALDAALSHTADCARCQDLVGTVARINSSVVQAEPLRSSRRWLAWFVPLTAAAAAAALWVALPDRNALVSPTPLVQDQDKVAGAKALEPAPPNAAPAESGPLNFRNTSPQSTPRRDVPQQPAAGAGPAAEVKSAASSDAATDKLERNELLERPQPDLEKAEATARPAAPAPAAAAAPAAEGAVGLTRSAARLAQAPAAEIVSPDPAVRWRLTGSVVQRSTNGGATWETASTGVAVELTAGAAPSASVCWLVGRAGVVLLTTDGRTWRRVAFPEVTDLSAVRSTDASGRAASVSAADGRTFSTADGGVTWIPR